MLNANAFSIWKNTENNDDMISSNDTEAEKRD